MPRPNEGMKVEAQKGLDWREEFGRGGTRVGAVRARQIVAGENLSDDTVKRMYSFFSRHEVDKEAEGFNAGEDGYPSNGRIAWALWGGDAGFSWSRRLVEQMKKEEERAVSGKALEMIKNKVEEHNEEVGDVQSKRTNVSTLSKVYERGIGAYKTNPASVRPTVSSPEQWAAARINSFLFALRNGKFRSGKHDTDLLPEGHPLSTKNKEEKSMENKENRHILNVTETDNTVIVEFEKHEDVEQEGEAVEMEATDSERPYHDEEEDRKVVDMPMKYRTIDLSKSEYIDEDNRRVRVGVSSEEPVERSFGMEVLGHSADDINMEFIGSGRAPLLLDHDMEKQIGVVEEFKLDETAKRTTAVVRFGKSALAREVFEDVKDGIRMNISVGYRIDKLNRMSNEDKVYYKAQWTPMEVSSVSVPADQSRLVGVGRSKDKQHNKIEVKTMENDKINIDEVKAQSVEEAKAEFKRNSKEIIDLAVRHNKRDLADKAIADGISVEEFRGVLLDNISNNTPLETPSEIGMTKEEVKRFSLVKAIRALANPSDRKAQAEAEFEFECSEAAAREYGKDAQGIMLPADVLRNWKRDINSSDDSTLIAEDYKGGDFIDVLRNSSSVMQAGATMLRGLQGNVVIPKKTAGASGGWIATEGTAASESEFTSGSVTMSPKVVGAFTDATRLLLQQSSLDVENLIRDDLTQAIATSIDLGALAGSGSSGQPTGIANTSGINTTTFAAANPTWAEIVAMESAVANDNALTGSLSYICRPADYGTLKTTEKASGTAQFVVSPDGSMNGYNVIRSNQVTSGDFYFGNFADLLIGMYGGLDITVDPYALSTSGGVRIVALQTVDVAVRHAVSFCKSSD